MPKRFKLSVLAIFLCSFELTADPVSSLLEGDSYYIQKQYNLAHLYYSEIYKNRPTSATASRLLLSSLRLHDTKLIENLISSRTEGDFTFNYLSLYSAYILNKPQISDLLTNSLKQSAKYQQNQPQFEYLTGAWLLNLQKFDAASIVYSNLSQQNSEVGQQSRQIVIELGQIESLPHKSPWLAAIFSTVIPGSGQIYSRQFSDGVMALFWNATFLGGAFYVNRLETLANRPHYGSGFLGLFGLMFYASNIAGGYSSAYRYNVFHQRKFVERLRKIHFSIDTIEEFSGIEFSRPIQ
ncbi:MAG: hypothetical protein H3C43_10560 [Leptonema sp. (in: Bacteria)]|nr:hypothetical protein [Leptonema sp. (in: bacteria)]